MQNSFDFESDFHINLPTRPTGCVWTLTSHSQEDKRLYINLWEFLSCDSYNNIIQNPILLIKSRCYVYKEFDHSSGWTLAVRLTHASRAMMVVTQSWEFLSILCHYLISGKRVRNTLISPPEWGITLRKKS